jgi:hypothetical protein
MSLPAIFTNSDKAREQPRGSALAECSDLPALGQRTIADEIETFGSYGRDVFFWTCALLGGGKIKLTEYDVYEPSLPEKPPLPSRIDWQSQLAPQSEPPPPEASQG